MVAKSTEVKKRKKKPTKLEARVKMIESIPAKERWWSVWECEASHTVASIASELPQGSATEEIWNRRRFESNMRRWMHLNKDAKHMAVAIFSR